MYVLGLVVGVIIGHVSASTAAPAADPDGPRIYCGRYTDYLHACTVADTGKPYKLRLTYTLNGRLVFVDTICSTIPLVGLKGESACATLGPDGNPATDDKHAP